MRDLPKISIVTPNFNGGEFLEETILSVISQNYPNLEYIIIDGGSNDNSVEIIRKYEKHLSYWISEPDKGLYEAIQKGFSKSTGEVMAWLNSDDMYHPGSLFTIGEIFSFCKEVNWIQGNPTSFDEYGRTVHCSNFRRWSKFDYYLYNYEWIQQESVFWRRSLWEKAGSKVDTTLKFAGDLELWLRFFRYDKLYVTRALIGGFRQRSKNQLSLESRDKYAEEAVAKIKSEVLTGADKKIVEAYKLLQRLSRTLQRTKVLNSPSILNYFERKYFDYPPIINFNRSIQRYYVHHV